MERTCVLVTMMKYVLPVDKKKRIVFNTSYKQDMNVNETTLPETPTPFPPLPSLQRLGLNTMDLNFKRKPSIERTPRDSTFRMPTTLSESAQKRQRLDSLISDKLTGSQQNASQWMQMWMIQNQQDQQERKIEREERYRLEKEERLREQEEKKLEREERNREAREEREQRNAELQLEREEARKREETRSREFILLLSTFANKNE